LCKGLGNGSFKLGTDVNKDPTEVTALVIDVITPVMPEARLDDVNDLTELTAVVAEFTMLEKSAIL
jgi:hypothetical protein